MLVKPVNNNLEITAHRGISIYKIPENTRAALREGLEKGFSVETDVQWTKSEQPILYHDDYIPGALDLHLNGGGFRFGTIGKKLVYDCTLDEIQNARFDTVKHQIHLSIQAGEFVCLSLNEAPKIATLDDLLPIPDGTKVYLELKRPDEQKKFEDGLEQSIVEWIKKNNLRDKVVVISFNVPGLYKVRSLDPNISIGVDVYDDFAKNPNEAKKLKDTIGITSWHPPLKDTNQKLVDEIHKLGLKIAPWTWDEKMAKELIEIERVINEGVDGVITNQAEKVREMLH